MWLSIRDSLAGGADPDGIPMKEIEANVMAICAHMQVAPTEALFEDLSVTTPGRVLDKWKSFKAKIDAYKFLQLKFLYHLIELMYNHYQSHFHAQSKKSAYNN